MLKDESFGSFDDLNNNDQTDIKRWMSRRSELLQRRVKDEMEAKLEEIEVETISNTPFVKALVSTNFDEDDESTTDSSSAQAWLTIWRPSTAQLDILRDGLLIRVKNLDIKPDRFGGLKQLSGNASTPMECLTHDKPTQFDLASEISLSSMFRIHLISKGLCKVSAEENPKLTFDVVAVALKVKEFDNGQGLQVYLMDESNLLLRVHCDSSCVTTLMTALHAGSNGFFLVVGFQNLQALPFDNVEHCAVAQYDARSQLLRHPSCQRSSRLFEWSTSAFGQSYIAKLSLCVDIGIQYVTCNDSATFKAIGYIGGFQYLSSKTQLLLFVDCGGSSLCTWVLPLAIFSAFAASCNNLEHSVSFNQEDEAALSQLSSMGRVFRARRDIYCFTLRSLRDLDVKQSECILEVSQISQVDTSALAALYATLLRN